MDRLSSPEFLGQGWRRIIGERLMEQLTQSMVATIRDAAGKMPHGAERRLFLARVSRDYLGGDARLTETVFGWSRHTVRKGLFELETGKAIPDAPRAYKPKTEVKNPQLEQDIRALVEPDSQTDPKFQSQFRYTRLTAKAVRQKLVDCKGYTDEELPHVSTIGRMLDRMGFKMRRVLKTKPQKKLPRQTPSSTTFTESTLSLTPTRNRSESPSTPRRS